MTVIGITGGTGAGKSTALKALETLGAFSIDCDAVYHELLNTSVELLDEIASAFPGVVGKTRKLNRKKLGKVVFSSPEKLEILNGIAHKYVKASVDETLSELESSGSDLAAIDAIALLESGLGDLCTFKVAVIAPVEIRKARIIKRDKINALYAASRVNSQKPDSFFIENCDYTLVNDFSDESEFMEYCIKYFSNILGGTQDDR